MVISRGMGYMLLATLLFTCMNVLVKLVPHIPAIEIIFFRSVISLLMSYVALKSQQVSVFGNNKKLLILRGAAGALALVCYFITLQNIPLASAVTLQYLSPVFTTILGIFLVREKVKPLQFLFFAMAFGGVLVIKGFDPRVTNLYLLLGIGAGFFAGLAYNIIRKLNTTEHPLVIVFYFPLVTLPLTGFYVWANWEQPQGIEWFYLILIGVLTQFAQYFMTKAYQLEELSKVASLNYIGILYAIGFGYFVFEESFHPFSYLGMLLVLAGVILNIQYKRKQIKPEKA
ncbi:DMT family transporter [Nafulsella turpanensis]|uniref:DMT family transporter n=1 Tax=Nafulsella turpanensis TaxID=1265690 RepID=UPI00034CEC71|nr:DMT family transporter [Nafulsella turpanensis]